MSSVPVDPEAIARAYVLAADLVVWWHEAGCNFYGKRAGSIARIMHGAALQRDEGLELLVNDACRVVGGWRNVRRIIRGVTPEDRARWRAIRLR